MITIATDGSCIGNPGPGAYGFYADLGSGNIIKRAIPMPATTVGEMEVRALLEALFFVSEYIDEVQGIEPVPVTIQCDSQYVVKGYNEWMAGWKQKGWKKSKGTLAHVELWKLIDQAKADMFSDVTVEWIRAHQNNGNLNDKIDEIVNNCARTQRSLNAQPYPDLTVEGAESGQRETSASADAASPSEITNMLVLSTGHITDDTADYLEHPEGTEIISYRKGDYGWFVNVEDDLDDEKMEDQPADLVACKRLARQNGCNWIMFDRDGPAEKDLLPYYVW